MDANATEATEATTCYRHPKRESYVRCTRCERYICPDCMREAPIGHQCVECVREGHRSIRPTRTRFGGRVLTVPAATYVLIALNALAYVGELVRPWIVDRFDQLGQGLVGPDGLHYVYQATTAPGFTPVGVAHGEWYRLITSAFLHMPPTQGVFGITHILFNMYWLLTLGRVLEQQLGRLRFVALYLISALGGSVLCYLVAPDDSFLGASGAIFGLAAAYFVLTRRMGYDPLGGRQLIVLFVIWMVVSAGITAWQGHLGGLLSGGAVGLAFAVAPRKDRTAVQVAGTVAVLLLLVVATVLKTTQLAGAA